MLLANDRYLYGKSIILDEMYPILKFLRHAAGTGKGISKNVMGITLREHTEIIHPLEPRRIKTEFVRNPFSEEIYIALKKGDYAYVHRSREKEVKKI